MSEARYAIYYAPPPDTPIWDFGSQVLGYDAATGRDVPQIAVPGHMPEDWLQATEAPRRYGFHATIKAPFQCNGPETALQAALSDFARARKPFRLGPLGVSSMPAGEAGKGFVAFTLQQPCPELVALERDVVIQFDRFRQPLTPADRARRNPDRLTERQQRHLDAYGYPFVLEDFRFHMTLTGALRAAEDAADHLADAAANRIGSVDLAVNDLCLFRQTSPAERFTIVSRHAFAGG